MDLTQDEHRSFMRALRRAEPITNTRFVNHLRHCKRCQNIVRQTSQLKRAVAYLQSTHLTVEQLLQYIADVKQSGYTPQTDSPEPNTRKVLAHLQECSLCRKRLTYYRHKFDSAEQIIIEPMPSEPEQSLSSSPPTPNTRFFKRNKQLVGGSVFAAMLCVVVFAVGRNQFAPYFQSPEQLRATVAYDNFDFLSTERRSSKPPIFPENDIRILLKNADFAQAQTTAQAAFAQPGLPEDERLLAHLYDLMATLKLAQRKKLFFILDGFDTTRVALAVARCEKAVANIAPDSDIFKTREYGLMCYYLGKASYISGTIQEAQAYINRAARIPNPRRSEALQLLEKPEHATVQKHIFHLTSPGESWPPVECHT